MIFKTVLRWFRQVHLYLGLLIFPWALFFGITAFSFNHPGIFRDLKALRYSAEELRTFGDVPTFEADSLAKATITQLKTPQGAPLSLEAGSAKFSGIALFSRKFGEQSENIIYSVDQGWLLALEGPKQAKYPETILSDGPIESPLKLTEIAEQLNSLPGVVIDGAQAPLSVHPKVHPLVRYGATDPQGEYYQISVDLASGEVKARKPKDGGAQPWIEVAEALHTQHHFQPYSSPLNGWAAFADITALSLILWSITGLVMAWAQKKRRMVVLSLTLIALAIGGLVLQSTQKDLRFVETISRGPN